MFKTDSFCYIYIYPILSSIFAGFIFWLIFSFFPGLKRKQSFSIGINNDLIKVNNLLFSYFDIFLKDRKHSTSGFQEKIHSCSLTENEMSLVLQNKIINSSFKYYPEINEELIIVGDEIEKIRNEINDIIKRLYSFNLFLSSHQVQNLRNIQEKIFRYSLERKSQMKIGNQIVRPINPSLSYMKKMLLELQEDYKVLREIIFKKNITDRSFILYKIQRLFYYSKYKKCIKICDSWLKKFPFDSDIQNLYKIMSLYKLNKKNLAYNLLENFLEKNEDIISNRRYMYELLSDSVAYKIIRQKIADDKIQKMKKIMEQEDLIKKSYLASNAKLKTFFEVKK